MRLITHCQTTVFLVYRYAEEAIDLDVSIAHAQFIETRVESNIPSFSKLLPHLSRKLILLIRPRSNLFGYLSAYHIIR